MSRLIAGLSAALLFSTVSMAVAQEPPQPKSTFFEEAKITVNERARADGYLRVRIRPEGGEAREATIDVLRRMSENDIVKTLTAALGPVVAPDYEVDRDAGEHMKIRKAKRSMPNFSVEITFSAPGFAVILDN